MLEEKDLQAIAQLMERQKQDIMSETKGLLAQQKQEILDETTQRMKVLLDTEVTPKFNLLAENQSIMMEKLERLDDIEVMDTRITALEAMVKKLNRDVEKLKKAQ
jgi:hypothetical protein|nr:MAG TPA: VASP tetramerization domain protein [Caudoviricetes sp.]